MSAITIKPCPFCGYADVEIDEIDIGIVAVLCPECLCCGPQQEGEHATEQAIEAWNKRAVPA